jgi:serine/threonine-protein kinase RsbT
VAGEGLVVPIGHEMDLVTARQKGRELVAAIGFGGTDQTLIATAISEVARNILVYAGRGEIVLAAIQEGPRRGVQIVARDQGPGIPNPALALQDGYSTSGSLGLGLPGARRLMDELELNSAPGRGTTVTMRKWVL